MKAWHWIVGLTVVTILLFGGWFMVVSTELTASEGLLTIIDETRIAASKNEWNEAISRFRTLTSRWENRRILFQLNQGEQDFAEFENSLANIHGGIEAEDKATVVSSSYVASSILQRMTGLIPRP